MPRFLRSLRWSAWLGWQIESNWTDPWLFAIYVLAKPLASSLLLVFMFNAARSAAPGAVPSTLLPFAYFGNAIYMLIGAVGFGMSAAVISDREHYGMLKYVRISPVSLRSYLLGRGMSGGVLGLLAASFVLAAGLLLPLGLTQALPGVAWGWLMVYLLLGVVMLLALGLILAGAVLNMARHGMFLSEGVGSAMYLLCGAIFPISLLPPWLQPVSFVLPPTYWMEGMRRALLGSGTGPLAGWDHPQIALALLLGTAAMVVVALFFFDWSERRAGRLGRYDVTTGY